MPATTPWLSGLTEVGWSAQGESAIYYPVNEAPTFNPITRQTAAGRRFAGYHQRLMNRYIGVGMGAASINIDMTGQSAVSGLPTGQWYGVPLMNACGFDETGTTTSILTLNSPSTGLSNVTAASLKFWQHDGSVWTISSAVGGCTLSIMPGEIPNATFNMVGVVGPTAAGQAQPNITIPPFGQAVAAATATFETGTFVIRSFVVSTNPVIAMRRSVAGTGGYAVPAITGYEVTAMLRIELDPANAAYDPETSFIAAADSGTAKVPTTPLEVSIKFAAGGVGTSTSADFITIAGDFLLDGQPTRVDDGEGIMCLDVPLILDPTAIADASDADGLAITWTAS